MELYEVKKGELIPCEVKTVVSCFNEFKTAKSERTGETETRCENIIVLDTETSSCWLDKEGNIYPYKKGKKAEFYNSLTPLAVLYEWTLSIDNKTFIGRELEDLGELFDNFPRPVSFLVWVHNLSFEFSFLSNLTRWDDYKAKTSREILEARGERWKNLTFRCSYALSGLSLEDWGKVLKLKKLKGSLDYTKLRTPKTPLKRAEVGYCVRDCAVVYKGLKGFKKTYKSLYKIPLTATGCVRREVRKRLRKDPKWQWNIKNLIPKSPEEYKRERDAYWGAVNITNRVYRGEVQEGPIYHFDFCSAYVAMMIAKKYPLTPWAYRPEIEGEFQELPPLDLSEYAYMMEVKFYNLRPRGFMLYIPSTRCMGVNIVRDNGRLVSGDEVSVYLTGEDLETAAGVYTWDKIEVSGVYSSHKKYLPRPYLEYILELFERKSKYKGVKNRIEDYHKNKTMLCSLYGMTVSAIVQGSISYNQDLDQWENGELTREEVKNKLEELKAETPWKMSYFLPYCVGVWVSAYAREALMSCVLYADNDSRALYCDTDSLYIKGESDFTWYNEKIKEEIKQSCIINKLDYKKALGLDIEGEEHHLGFFEPCGVCSEFLTLGCKKYIERNEKGELVLTLSGVKKTAVSCLDNNIENFKEGFTFDKDAPGMDKLMTTYCDIKSPVVFPDGYVLRCRFGVNLRPVGYELKESRDEYDSFDELIDILERGVNQQFLYSIRGDF